MKNVEDVTNKRVTAVAELIVKGYSRTDIIQYAAREIIDRDGAIVKTSWDATNAQVDEYISQAAEMIEQNNVGTTGQRMAIAGRRLDMVFNRAMQEENFTLAFAVQKEYNELYNLKNTGTIQPTDDIVATYMKKKSRATED